MQHAHIQYRNGSSLHPSRAAWPAACIAAAIPQAADVTSSSSAHGALDGRALRIATTLGAMPLSLDDLARAAAGCRALAEIYRQDAAKQSNPLTREGLEREVMALTALAERFDRARAARAIAR
jgi:hypothetical protein